MVCEPASMPYWLYSKEAVPLVIDLSEILLKPNPVPMATDVSFNRSYFVVS